ARPEQAADRAEEPRRQTGGERQDRGSRDADDDARERGGHVAPELPGRDELEHRSQNEPGPREENRIEEVEEHDEPGREAPQEEKRENGAETQHECASPRQQRSAESPLHQVRHRAHGTSPWWTYHARGGRLRQPAPEPAIIGERRTMTA